jgi:hypothetical protein
MRSRLGSILDVVVVAVLFAGCTGSSQTSVEQSLKDQGCTVNEPDPRACDPADTKKTTVCHIPPGNPANAHTICVGNPAVPAHLDHGDFVGTCACTTDIDAGVEIDAFDCGSGCTGVGLQ